MSGRGLTVMPALTHRQGVAVSPPLGNVWGSNSSAPPAVAGVQMRCEQPPGKAERMRG